MNKTAIGAIIGIIVIGAIAIFILNQADTNSNDDPQAADTGSSITRPAVEAVPNTFSVMTPEEKLAAEEAARIQAEQAAQASSSASSSATTTEEAERTTENP